MVAGSPTDEKSENKWHEKILRRELIIQATTTMQLAEKLQHSEQYPNDTPPKLCRLFRKTIEVILSHLEKIPAEHLKLINVILCKIAENLRFVDRSRVTQTPWSMIQASESFLKNQVGEEFHFIIRPQWAFNYGVEGEFVDSCKRTIKALPVIPFDKWNESLDEDIRNIKIYSVSFPRIQRLNCLYHSNWGHEVGHIIVSRWLDKEFTNIWTREEDKIKAAIEAKVRENPPPVDELFKELFIQQAVADKTSKAMDAARRGLEELLCDHIGVHLMGPAALAAACEFSARYLLDESPLKRSFYPPWRYRLRLMLDACKSDLEISAEYPGTLLSDYVSWLQELNDITSNMADHDAINQNIETKEAYRIIKENWDTWRKDILASMPTEFSKPYRLRERLTSLNDLVDKLLRDIPPNEVGSWPTTAPSALQDILNAGWAFKMKQLSTSPSWNTPSNHEKLFRLLLKAIESSHVHALYNSKSKKADNK